MVRSDGRERAVEAVAERREGRFAHRRLLRPLRLDRGQVDVGRVPLALVGEAQGVSAFENIGVQEGGIVREGVEDREDRVLVETAERCHGAEGRWDREYSNWRGLRETIAARGVAVRVRRRSR